MLNIYYDIYEILFKYSIKREIKDFIHSEEDSPNMKDELDNILTSIPSASSQASSNNADDTLTPRSNLSDIYDLCNHELTAEDKLKLKKKGKNKDRKKIKEKKKKLNYSS